MEQHLSAGQDGLLIRNGSTIQDHRREALRRLCGLPLGLKGIVVGEGDSYEQALADVKSAIKFHIQTFGNEVLPDDSPLIEAFIEEATISA